jgi:hypothetical protein
MMTNNYTEVKAINSLITYIKPVYTLNLYQLEYLSQQKMITF